MRNLLLIVVLIRVFLYLNNDLIGKSVLVTGRVLREPAIYEKSQRVVIQDFESYIPKYPEVEYGDIITIKGSVVKDREIKDPTVVSLRKPEFPLFNLRNKIIENLLNLLPKQHASIVAGVTLGSQKSISNKFWDDLKRTGTAHIVVASGTNVTYTSFFFLSLLLLFLKRKRAIYITLCGIWVYVMLSGFDPPLVRAALMGSLVFVAQIFGRVTDTISVLLLTVLIMLIIKPSWISDVGFALSFYATTSLILFEASIYRLLSKIPLIVRKDFSTTLTAQIGVSPILWIVFKQFNILSPVYNVLVLWTIPPIMILGSIAGLISLFSQNIAKFFALLLYPFTSWFIFVTSL